jgi:hypothetical protein
VTSPIDASPCFPTPAQTLLLRAALLDGEPGRAAFRAWRAAVDPEALEEASYRLLPLLSRNLVRLGVQDPSLERWRGVYRRWFASNTLLFQDARAALEALARAGIPTLLVKGAALVATLGASGERPMRDLDLLVPPGRARDAFAALRGAGWRSISRRPERLVDARHGTPFAAPSGRQIDLHWFLLWENCFGGADAPLWDAAREARLGASPVRVPAPEDVLLHACVHGLQCASGPAIRWAADVTLLSARRAADLDWERVAREAARRRVAVPVRTALRWARERLDAPVPDAALARIEAIPTGDDERREMEAKLRPMVGLSSLAVYWSYHRRAREGEGLGVLGRIATFAPYLQRNWELDHPMELPYFLFYRSLRRLGIDAGLVDPRRPLRRARGPLARSAS